VSAPRANPIPLETALETPHGKERYVRRLFHTIADRYDLITALLSFGRDRAWKRRLVGMAAAPGARALDLACGTGDITFELASQGARVVGLDVTPRMIELARRKTGSDPITDFVLTDGRSESVTGPDPVFIIADIMALPFADRSFDVVTAGYGLRNVPLIEPALEEIARVLRPGGVLLSLDFNRPEGALVRAVYLAWLTFVGSVLGWALHGDPDTYRYIPATIRRYPGAARVTQLMRAHGFSSAAWHPVLGGLLAIHHARRA
jgi:demethylmenaquinone methyltransferase/2-methoxy-6-polyprenyl-1,4-benzoquinol methylase